MTTQPNGPAASRAIRLNLREVYPVHSLRHPVALSTPPSDAVAVIWLDSEGPRSDPRFAYLNRARAEHLLMELHRILQAGDHPVDRPQSAVERAQRLLRRTGQEGQASGA
jgi:hypothetical protein